MVSADVKYVYSLYVYNFIKYVHSLCVYNFIKYVYSLYVYNLIKYVYSLILFVYITPGWQKLWERRSERKVPQHNFVPNSSFVAIYALLRRLPQKPSYFHTDFNEMPNAFAEN